jgi:hypothetical protein
MKDVSNEEIVTVIFQKMQKIIYCKFKPSEFTQFRFVIVSSFLDAFFCLLLSIFVFLISKKAYSKVNYPIQRVDLFSNGIFSSVPCLYKI